MIISSILLEIGIDLGRTLVRIGRKTPSKLASCNTHLQGLLLGLAWDPKLSRLQLYQKALSESGACEVKASCYSDSWSNLPGAGRWGLLCP